MAQSVKYLPCVSVRIRITWKAAMAVCVYDCRAGGKRHGNIWKLLVSQPVRSGLIERLFPQNHIDFTLSEGARYRSGCPEQGREPEKLAADSLW